MSETLSKRTTAEMKRHGSKKERQAAVSVQVGRIAEKLLQRSRDLQDNSVEHPSNAQTIFTTFSGAPEGNNAYSKRDYLLNSFDPNYYVRETESTQLTSGEKTVKPFLRKERQAKRVNIVRQGQKRSGASISSGLEANNYNLEIDPEGERKPIAYTRNIYDGTSYEHSYTPSAEGVVNAAAPELYEIKKGIDQAEDAARDKKAA